ncbi:MAG: branched-chain amino acid ABC transporter permease [Chloroflexi bacterium]|nr:branched-chain amino acid ABC transporter permease [Chloroflexota bacterium]
MIDPYWLEIFTIAGINAIIALGLYITMMTGQISVAHAAFAGIGGYTVGVLTVNFGLPFAVGLAAGGLLGAVFAIGLSLLILRLRHFYLAVATVGFGEALVVLAMNSDYLGGATGFRGIPRNTNLLLVLALLALVVFCAWRLQDSRVGQAFRSISDDEVTAAAIGINVRGYRILSFALGSGIAAFGGGLQAQYLGLMQAPDMNFLHSVTFLVFVAFGGTQIFWGPLLGSILLTLLPELLRFSLYDRYVIYGALLVVMMVFRPNGLVSRRPITASEAPGRWLGAIRWLWRRQPERAEPTAPDSPAG